MGGLEGVVGGRAVAHELPQQLLDVGGGEALAGEGRVRPPRGQRARRVGGAVDAVQGAAHDQAQRGGGHGVVAVDELRRRALPRWARLARPVAGAVERVRFGGCVARVRAVGTLQFTLSP